jgi:hypothetical protein
MNLAEHGRRELEIIGEEPDVIEWYVRVIRTFAEFGHSGASAAITTQVLSKLLAHEALSPLTDDKNEWLFHPKELWDGEFPVWQNVRDSRAFSDDAGRTYWLVSDKPRRFLVFPRKKYKSKRKVGEST